MKLTTKFFLAQAFHACLVYKKSHAVVGTADSQSLQREPPPCAGSNSPSCLEFSFPQSPFTVYRKVEPLNRRSKSFWPHRLGPSCPSVKSFSSTAASATFNATVKSMATTRLIWLFRRAIL